MKASNRKTGFQATLVILFSVIFILYNMDIHTDIVLFTNVALSLWMLHNYLTSEKKIFLIGGGIALGISILTKGPFGVFIPIVSSLAYLIAEKRISKISVSNIIILLLITLTISSLAIIPFFLEKGFKGVWFFLWENNFKRVIGHYGGGSTDYSFYLHNLLYLLLPWSVFLLAGFYFLFKNLIKRKFSSNDHFIFWGLFSFLILISLSKNKLPNYLMSALPFIAIITAQGWNEVFSKGLSKVILFHKGILYLFISLLFIIPIYFLQEKNLIFWGLVVLAAFVSITFIRFKTKETTLLFNTLISMAFIGFFLNVYLFPLLFNLQGAPKAAKVINEKSRPQEKIYYLYPKDIYLRDSLIAISKSTNDDFSEVLTELHFFRNYEFMFYCKKPIMYIEKNQQIEEIINEGNAWIYTDFEGLDELKKHTQEELNIFPFPNVELNNPMQYMNRKTRERSFKKMFLVHLNNDIK